MSSKIVCLTAALVLSGSVLSASAQTAAPAPAATPAPATSKMKLSKEKIHDMYTKWRANKPKLKTCRAGAKAKGLVEDDRIFFIEDCMAKN
jgi:hypothetical protein